MTRAGEQRPAGRQAEQVREPFGLLARGGGELGPRRERHELFAVTVGSVHAVDEGRVLEPLGLPPPAHDRGRAEQMVEERPLAGMSERLRSAGVQQVDEPRRSGDLSHRSPRSRSPGRHR